MDKIKTLYPSIIMVDYTTPLVVNGECHRRPYRSFSSGHRPRYPLCIHSLGSHFTINNILAGWRHEWPFIVITTIMLFGVSGLLLLLLLLLLYFMRRHLCAGICAGIHSVRTLTNVIIVIIPAVVVDYPEAATSSSAAGAHLVSPQSY